MAFSDVTEAQANAMYEGMDTDNDYDIKTTPLPEDLKAEIREDYARLVGSMLPPWEQNEVHKRRYIDAVLSRLVFAVNESTRAKDEATKLLLFPEYGITLPELNAAGAADWVIKRGERMLVVIEAKQCDIRRGQYQLLAMMEALRIHNKKLNIKQHKIQAICTDFQDWLFVERESRTLRKKLKGTVPATTTKFEENLLDICERVYTMLLNL